MRVLFVFKWTALLRTAWDRMSSYFIHILTPFSSFTKTCVAFHFTYLYSAKTVDLGPYICPMQNNYWPLPGFITGQFCSRLIAMGTPGVGTGCLSWELRHSLYSRFYSGRSFRKWIAIVPNAIVLSKRSVWYSLSVNPLKHFDNSRYDLILY